MSATAPELRTTTLVVGPFPKPLSQEHVLQLASVAAQAIGLGYAVMRAESEDSIKLVAVISAPRTQPFTRVSDLVPGAVVTALAGEATAQEV